MPPKKGKRGGKKRGDDSDDDAPPQGRAGRAGQQTLEMASPPAADDDDVAGKLSGFAALSVDADGAEPAAAAPRGGGAKKGSAARNAAKREKEAARRCGKAARAAEVGDAADGGAAAEQPELEAPWFVDIKGRYKKVTRDITIENLGTSIGGKTLIKDGCRLTLVFGKKYGIVGRNGLGKSVFMRRVADERAELGIPLHIKILFVEQEVTADDTTPLQSVLAADQEREWLLAEERVLLAEAEKEADPTLDFVAPRRAYTITDVYERLRDIESDKAESRASAILAGLGFDLVELKSKPTKAFSGGWRMRIALARALFCKPDYLMLDEPNNHLDLEACIWLESYLSRWDKTLLVVSHDSSFLNTFVDHILHLHQQTLTNYRGDYDSYILQRSQQRRAKEKTHKTQTKQEAAIKSLTQKNSKLGKQRAKMMQKLEKIVLDVDDPTMKFSFPECGPLDEPMPLKFKEVGFKYSAPGSKPLFRKLEFGIDLGSRIALVGRNGVGKSTLMKLMAGELEPSIGLVERDRKMRVAKFSQHHMDQLRYDQTPIEYMQERFGSAQTQDVRNHLARFGVTGQLATQKIATLSGGQKSRVSFAELAWQKPHLLFLDEPTNHLDVEAIESLAHALAEFDGGVILITHNQSVVELCCSEIWICGGAKVTPFDGDLQDYKALLAKDMNLEVP